MKGKAKCKILREIRRKIAEENDIELITKDCTYQGECKGTCPKCEAEVRYLEQELEKRKQLGKAVTVAALAASLTVGLTGCVPGPVAGKLEAETTDFPITQTMGLVPKTELDGDVLELPTDATETMGVPTEPILGELPLATENTDCYELEGDVAYVTETTDAP